MTHKTYEEPRKKVPEKLNRQNAMRRNVRWCRSRQTERSVLFNPEVPMHLHSAHIYVFKLAFVTHNLTNDLNVTKAASLYLHQLNMQIRQRLEPRGGEM